ncbi:MAG: putative cysteine desulfurase 2 [Candidatus Thorarchaeota archaeon AB_25]|nr:MAG: putative cysteine desulfurase 2 [Candidatus Thorarchaeota archaeon AB_25]
MKQVYLDYQSAKPVDPRVIEGMSKYLHEAFGNPSALHQVGDVATDALDESRKAIAKFINAEEDEIIFTSGATEAINMGMIGYALRNKNKGNHIIISEIEHISIHNIAKHLERQGFEVSKVPVDQYGRVDIRKLERRITDKTILISIGFASNEIGTIQPINEIGKLAAAKDIAFFTDAVAAEGLVPIDVRKDNINLMALSSNDLYGPRGVGVMYMQKKFRVNPILIGGGQEKGLRSGSEDIPGIVGMKLAADIMNKEMKSEVKRFQGYRDRMIKQILEEVPDSYLNGHPTDRLASNAHFRFDGIEGESILLSFKDLGISVSTGSACTSKTLEPSHTLIATGLLHEEAHGSLQLTTGRFNTDGDIDRVLEVVPQVVSRLRDLSPIYKKK